MAIPTFVTVSRVYFLICRKRYSNRKHITLKYFVSDPVDTCWIIYQYVFSCRYKEHSYWWQRGYIQPYRKILILRLATSKRKDVRVIEIWMKNISHMCWKYLRQQGKKKYISNCCLILWRTTPPNFYGIRECWTRLNDCSINHICFLKSY